MKIIEGSFSGENLRIAVVGARWNQLVTERLLEGAVSFFKRQGGVEENLTLVRVPGAAEIPVVCKKLCETGSYKGLVALATVIRGETSHHEIVASVASNGIHSVSMQYSIPIGLGILTTNNLEQALERSGGKAGNKGEEAMAAVLETVNLIEKIPGH